MLLGWGSGGTYGLEWLTATYAKFFGVYALDDWERFQRLNWFVVEAPSIPERCGKGRSVRTTSAIQAQLVSRPMSG